MKVQMITRKVFEKGNSSYVKWVLCFASVDSQLHIVSNIPHGRAIAQAVSRWLSTAACRARARVWSCGICDGQSGAGAGFLRVLRFPLPIFTPPVAPESPSSITWGWYSRRVVDSLSPTENKITVLEMEATCSSETSVDC
jgi:hypothetical protein